MKTSVSPVVIAFAFACFALVQNAQAVSPPPDGGYGQGNTAEGTDALFSLTLTFPSFGAWNTALGHQALYNNATANQNTATGYQTLFSNTFGNKNTAYGAQALYHHVLGDFNTATGFRTLYTEFQGSANTGDGFEALASNDLGFENTASGYMALYHTGGGLNTAVGSQALFQNTTGSGNVALGSGAGGNIVTANNVIAIGNAGADVNNSSWISNIYQTATVSGTTLPVIISDQGQLGTAPSSRRFKTDIRAMDKTSETILALKPVTFHYKSDKNNTPQFGLIAEDVEKVNHNLIVRDPEGKPHTVRYYAMNAMLLNEFLKEHRKVQEQNSKIQEQEATITELKSTVAQQQKGLQTVTARLEQQAAQIQKVSAKLEINRTVPQIALDSQ
jgi:Chaperone of endosialidase